LQSSRRHLFACYPWTSKTLSTESPTLYSILRCYGISDLFIDRLKKMYDGATSSIQLSGHTYGPILIRCAIRQCCPMSTMLYALCLHPLLRMLEQRLPGIQIGRRASPTSVVAYADDITIFVTSTDDFHIIEDAIHQYE